MNITDRILQFLDYKGITKYEFHKKNNFSNGFLDKSRAIGSDKCAIILENYPEINPEWLIMGKGEMLKEGRATYYAQGNLVGGNLTQGNETTTVANSSLDKNNEQILEILQKELELKNKIIAKLMGLEEK